jgi:glycine dehydrogenase
LLEALEQKHEFIGRHIGPQGPDQQAMLRELGLSSLEELADKVVPPAIRSDQPLALSEGVTEQQGLARLGEIASRNQVCKSLIGMGYYNTYTPTVIVRNILENPAWYTAYTPYQPEISQGRLEAMLNFQTMVTELTGLDIANASLLDEATAAAEAMALCHRTSRTRRDVFFVCADCHPQTIDVIRTRAEPVGIEVVVGDVRQDFDPAQYFAVLLQYPASTGAVHDYREIVDKARGEKTLVIFAADLLALAVLTPPGELGADIAVGNSQRFGVPLCFGGPHAAYLATRESYKRGVPGRLVGVSVDSRGAKAYRLSLQTREQHIRREKATSNICTAQALLAVMASMYAVYHGPQGLSTIARRVHRLTAVFAEGLGRMGCEVGEEWFFDTVSVRTQSATDAVMSAALARGVNLRRVDDDTVGVSLDETVAREDVQTLWDIFAVAGGQAPDFAAVEADTGERIPESLRRSSAFLTHPVFNSYRSETEMLRYIRHLGDKDLALDRAMIPLGSCTMKLNATTQMLPITWEAFSGIHPFVPAEQAQGYRQLTDELEQMLCACTGYDAVSLQPNAGSQGEFAGLLAIRAWHASRGESHRDICLIPSSAHGTNPASAAMAGMKVVVVGCDEDGNIDVENLQAKAAEHAGRLAAIMITYPSTHGVFEEAVTEVCDIVHRHGGQVYIDGANLNALVGVAYPGRFGGDVSHLNLHKTFCIPHGGGGPGVGPIGVREHLKPFLPGHRLLEHTGRQASMGAVAAAPWGSAGILPISWMYIALMGREGMRHATLAAILNANYIAWRLKEHYPVLYTGPNGMVAHECILDLRPLKEETGVTVDDVAKRLIDYGFHAPTMSFPVSGTLMVEPTESESREELDRFCDAMIRIREEIRGIENGTLNEQDNPLKNAPHTVADLVETHWDRGYTREQAVFPVASLRERKYWSPVGRVDNVYGDRNLVCSCPPLSAYEDAAD